MAYYATKYTITYDSAARTRCVVELQQKNYAGSVTELTPAKEPSRIRWGWQRQQDNLVGQPILPADARIQFKGDAAASSVFDDLFDIGAREWRVRFLEGTAPLTDEDLVWQGYVLDDLIQDNPFSESETIELVAADGFKILENLEQVNQLTDTYAYNFANILQELHDLDIVTSMNWEATEAGVPAGDTALSHLYVPYEGYREMGDRDKETEQLTQRQQLEDMLQRFGLVLFQYGGQWHIHQRDQIDPTTGQIQQWTMPAGEYQASGATLFNSTAQTVNLRVGDLMEEGNGTPYVLKSEKPGAGIQRLRSVTSVHQYDGLGNLIQDAGFEAGFGAWTPTTPDETTAERLDYDNTVLTVNSTQEDRYVLKLDAPGTTTTSVPRIEQSPDALLYKAGPDAAYRFRFDLAVATANGQIGTRPYTQLKVEGESENYYLTNTSVDVAQEADAAEDGVLYVSEIPGAEGVIQIPKGAVLTIAKDGNDGFEPVSEITLSEAAYGGQKKLKGEIQDDITTGDGQRVHFYIWTAGETVTDPFDGSNSGESLSEAEDYPNFPIRNESLTPQTLDVPQHTPVGDPVVGDLFLRFSITFTTSVVNTIWLDNVEMRLLVDGEEVDETRITIVDPNMEDGQHLEITHRVGDGPIPDHPRGIDYDLFEGTPITRSWTDPADTSGKLLERFTAENLMRQQRRSLRRYNFRLTVREGQELTPLSVYEVSGDLYTVGMMERRWASHANDARMQLDELKDFGAAGLEQGFSMGSSSPSTGTGGGSSSPTFVGSQTVEGASSWSELAGKPPLVNTFEGRDGDITLQSGDVTGALGFTPRNTADPLVESFEGRTGDVTLKSSDVTSALGYTPYEEDTALTSTTVELANKEYADGDVGSQASGMLVYDASTGLALDYGSAGSGIAKGTSVILDAKNTLTGPNISITGGQVSDSRPTISLIQGSGSGLNADLLDGYEGSDLAALAEDEVVTGNWRFQNQLIAGANAVPYADADLTVRAAGTYGFMVKGSATRLLEVKSSSGATALSVQDGEVGINTNSPSAAFEVQGDAKVDLPSGGTLHIDDAIGGGGSVDFVNNAGDLRFSADDDGTQGSIRFYTAGQNERLTIDPSGDASFYHSVSALGTLTIEGISTFNDDVIASTIDATQVNLSQGLYIGLPAKETQDWPLAIRTDSTSSKNGANGDFLQQWCYTEGASEYSLNLGFSTQTLDGWVLKSDTTAQGAQPVSIGFSTVRPEFTVSSNRVQFDGDLIERAAGTGFTGSGFFYNRSDNRLWLDNLSVRGTLLAFEFEARKITTSRGPLAVSPGGGKIESVEFLGNGEYNLHFAENPGIGGGDLLLIKDIDASGKSVNVAVEVYFRAISSNGSNKTVKVDYLDGGLGASGYLETSQDVVDLCAGKDIAVVGSTDTSRDSLLYLDPYTESFDVLSGIQTINDWQSRSPKVRLGNLNGINSGDLNPSGYGLYAENAFLKGEIVATEGRIGAWTITTDAITAVNNGITTALNVNDDASLPWATSVAGLQIGTDINNRMWFGNIGGDYDMRVRVGGEYLVQLGSIQNVISGWELQKDVLYHSAGAGREVHLGQYSNARYGLRVTAGGSQVRMWDNDGDPELLAYTDASNYISIGSGFQRVSMGITVRAAGSDILYTDTTGARFGNVDVTGDLVMDGGAITNTGSDFSLTATEGLVLTQRQTAYVREAALTFVDSNGNDLMNLWGNTAYTALTQEIGRLWLTAKDPDGRVTLLGGTSADGSYLFVEEAGISLESRQDIVFDAAGQLDVRADATFLRGARFRNPLVLERSGSTAGISTVQSNFSGDLVFTPARYTRISDLPTSDPEVEGALWVDLVDGNTLKVSSGPVGNTAPTAALSVSTSSFTAYANASGSSDDDGDALEYQYDWGDGTATSWLTSDTAQHTYSTENVYTITLTVRDPDGATDTDSATVDVSSSSSGGGGGSVPDPSGT